jgi:hypothetical protein
MTGHVQRQRKKEMVMVNISCSVIATKSAMEFKSGAVNW